MFGDNGLQYWNQQSSGAVQDAESTDREDAAVTDNSGFLLCSTCKVNILVHELWTPTVI